MKKSFNRVVTAITLATALTGIMATSCNSDLFTVGLGPAIDLKAQFNRYSYYDNGNLKDAWTDDDALGGSAVVAKFGDYRSEQLGNESAIQEGAKFVDFSGLQSNPAAYKVQFKNPTETVVIFEGYNTTGISGSQVVNTPDTNGVIVKQKGEHVTATRVSSLGK